MAKNEGDAKLDLYLDSLQVQLLQRMIDSGIYGTISVPNSTGGRFVLSHVAMNGPASHIAMNSPLSHIAMNGPPESSVLSHIAMNSPITDEA